MVDPALSVILDACRPEAAEGRTFFWGWKFGGGWKVPAYSEGGRAIGFRGSKDSVSGN